MRNIILLLVPVLWLSGCQFNKPVEFRIIDNVKVLSIEDGMVNLEAQAIFYNPNDMKGKLKGVNIMVRLDDKNLATITHSKALKIGPETEFSIPITIQFAVEDVQDGLIKNIMNILTDNKIKLHFVGDIKVSTMMVSQKVKVDYYEEVKLQL